MTPLRPIVFAEGDSPGAPAAARRAARTERALRLAGLDPTVSATGPLADLAGALTRGPVWLVRAGTWPVAPPTELPPPSHTGLPLCALGRTFAAPDGAPPGETPAAWDTLLAATGGDLDATARAGGPLPRPDSVYLEAPLSRALADLLATTPGLPLAQALSRLLRVTGSARPARARRGWRGHSAHGGDEEGEGAARARVVCLSKLDVFEDTGLRVAQIVTSVQQGGAERVALDLTRELGRHGIASRLFSVWRPSRRAFAVPEGSADLSAARGDRDRRFRLLAAELAAWGADLAHSHLFPREDLARLATFGYRSLVTVHNMSPGWPPELATTGPAEAVLLVACARAVESDLTLAGVPAPTRTVWNGIHPPLSADRAGPAARAAARRDLGLGPADLVLLALANPRPQKRLHLLPAVLAEVKAGLARAGLARRAILILAGDTSPASPGGIHALAEFNAEVTRLDLAPDVRATGSVDDVSPLLAACDVLVSPSAHEGLSLAHLEALAASRPVVATGAGGTAELAALSPALTFVPEDPDPVALAAALAAAVLAAATSVAVPAAVPLSADQAGVGQVPAQSSAPPSPAVTTRPAPLPGGPEIVTRHFTVPRMAEGYARLYPRAALVASRSMPVSAPSSPATPGPGAAAAASHRHGEGILLVTNNFSTGGAQSSARRLLLGLAERGVRARAAVIEEQPGHPTPGRTALIEAGIPVLSLPPPAAIEPGESVRRLLAWMEESPPRAVIFWNTIPEHKVLLAEALFDLPVFDVSPGEMYFESLARYFASPRPGHACRSPRDYGARLAGVFVKYAAEAAPAAHLLGAPVHVVPNGIPLGARLPVRDRSPLVLGTTVRIHPHKKLDELLAAVRLAAPRMPPFRLRIAGAPDRGQDTHAADLRAGSADLPVDWIGEVQDSAPFLADLDIFVLVAEPAGCPNASLEALAVGLPVIATDVGGMSEQIEDGISGRLVPRAAPAAHAEAMVSVARDPSLRARLSCAAHARARDRFSMSAMIEAYRRPLLACDDDIPSRSRPIGRAP